MAVALRDVVEDQKRVIAEQRSLLRRQGKVLGEAVEHVVAAIRSVADDAWLDEQARFVEEMARIVEQQSKALSEATRLQATQASKIDELVAKLATAQATVEAMERRVYGPRSEKMPPVARELRREETPEEAEQRRLRALERRRDRAALRERLRRDTVIHHVADEDMECPHCGGVTTSVVGEGQRTTMYEYVPGYFVKQEHVQEKLARRCGQYIATADPPPRPIDKASTDPASLRT